MQALPYIASLLFSLLSSLRLLPLRQRSVRRKLPSAATFCPPQASIRTQSLPHSVRIPSIQVPASLLVTLLLLLLHSFSSSLRILPHSCMQPFGIQPSNPASFRSPSLPSAASFAFSLTCLSLSRLILLNRLASNRAFSAAVLGLLTQSRATVSLNFDVADRIYRRGMGCRHSEGPNRTHMEAEVTGLSRVFKTRISSFLTRSSRGGSSW